MYTRSAHLYDTIYLSRGKNHAAEAESVHQLIQQNLRAGGNRLPDVACGTGLHASYLRAHYQVDGLDLDARMLESAKQKCPDLTFHLTEMRDLDMGLGRQFDVITCRWIPLRRSVYWIHTFINGNPESEREFILVMSSLLSFNRF